MRKILRGKDGSHALISSPKGPVVVRGWEGFYRAQKRKRVDAAKGGLGCVSSL